MADVDKTAPGQTDAITFELELKHPPQRVWRALTEPELLSAWLLPIVELKLEPGAAFSFQAPPQPGWDGFVSCKMVDVEEHRSLRYRWVVGDLDTEVAFTLTPTDAGTLLVIVQSGFLPEQKQNFAGARYGWRMMTAKLLEVLELPELPEGA